MIDSASDKFGQTGEDGQLKVLDLEHLGKYTGGDEALRRELLALFIEQVGQQISVVGQACPQQDWMIATHTLKGAARAVGAWQIAETAEALEQIDPEDQDQLRRELVQKLTDQADGCRAAIDQVNKAA